MSVRRKKGVRVSGADSRSFLRRRGLVVGAIAITLSAVVGWFAGTASRRDGNHDAVSSSNPALAPSAGREQPSATLYTDADISAAANRLFAVVNPLLSENSYFPPFAKAKISWVAEQQKAGKLSFILLKNVADAGLSFEAMMASARPEGRPVIIIARPRFTEFLSDGGLGSLPFTRQQRNDFGLSLVHEVVHLENPDISSATALQDHLVEEQRAWREVDVNVVRELRRLHEPMNVEAYGSYLAPVGKGLQIDFGKFVTHNGAEVIEAKDDWNYSRSILFSWAIPYFHSGVRLIYSPTDKVTVAGGVVNGWNDVVENNTGKTVWGQVTFKPTAAFTITQNYTGGPEQANDNADWRTLSDTIAMYTFNPMVSVMANYDYGRDTVAGVTQTWQGIAGYVKIQANKWVAVIPRAEYYSDPNGFTLGTTQKLSEATVTLEIKGVDGFLWRIEYRGDFSDHSVFKDSSGAASKTQHSIALGFLYSFSSKS